MKKSTQIIIYILCLFVGVQMLLLFQWNYTSHRGWIGGRTITEIQERYGEFDLVKTYDDSSGMTGYYILIPEYHGILGDQPAVVYSVHCSRIDSPVYIHKIFRCYLTELTE